MSPLSALFRAGADPTRDSPAVVKLRCPGWLAANLCRVMSCTHHSVSHDESVGTFAYVSSRALATPNLVCSVAIAAERPWAILFLLSIHFSALTPDLAVWCCCKGSWAACT